jgi:hypothetical protein
LALVGDEDGETHEEDDVCDRAYDHSRDVPYQMVVRFLVSVVEDQDGFFCEIVDIYCVLVDTQAY